MWKIRDMASLDCDVVKTGFDMNVVHAAHAAAFCYKPADYMSSSRIVTDQISKLKNPNASQLQTKRWDSTNLCRHLCFYLLLALQYCHLANTGRPLLSHWKCITEWKLEQNRRRVTVRHQSLGLITSYLATRPPLQKFYQTPFRTFWVI